MRAWSSEHRARLAAGGAVAVLGVAVLLGELGGADPGDRVRADARRVHCLSVKQRPELVQAAVRLEVAAPGSTDARLRPLREGRPGAPLTLDEWSRRFPDGFTRACEPLAALTGRKALQDPPPKPPLWRRVLTNPVFTLLLGGVLTAVVSAHAARGQRRRDLADRLATAAAEYLKTAQAVRLARSWEKPADRTGLEGRRVDLRAAILSAGLRDADRRNLERLLGRAHRTLVGAGFQAAPAEEAVRRLEAALGRALCGEPVPAADAGEENEPARLGTEGRP